MANAYIEVPAGASTVLKRLRAAGYEAFVVGGSVRDSLLGRTPGDWDMTTSALPEEIKAVFAGERLIETGLRHGTVTVLLDGAPYEITTYRVDGDYTDCRRPDQVRFTGSLAEDLARRDFTVCAMAYSPEAGLVDLFDGRSDLKNKTIRCVGDPAQRFGEDALRILRAIRFASVLDFDLEAGTAAAVFACRELLRKIAPERIREELCKLLCGPAAGRILREYRSVLEVFLPEIRSMYGFRQNTPYHAYDVWEHTVRALEAAPARPVYRLAMLCHDMGKPARYTVDGRGQGHFHGHPAESERLAGNILRRLRFDHKTAAAVCELIRFHDYRLEPSAVLIRKLLALLGPERLQQLLNVQRADAAGKADEAAAEQTARVNAAAGVLDEVLARGDCYTLRGLQIGGGDLLAIGVSSGPQIGTLLQKLLDEVMEDRLENDREALRRRAAVMMQERTQKEQA